MDWGPLRNELRQFHDLPCHRVFPTRVRLLFMKNIVLPSPSYHRTYLISDSIPALYYTEIVGDARELPTILAAANFNPAALSIFGKPMPAGCFPTVRNPRLQTLTLTSLMDGVLNTTSTRTTCMFSDAASFLDPTDPLQSFRAIKNLVIDTTRVPPHVVYVIIAISGGPCVRLVWVVRRAYIGKFRKQPLFTTSSSNSRPPSERSIGVYKWKMEGMDSICVTQSIRSTLN